MPQLCCLGSNEPEPSTQVPAHPEAGFMRRVDSHQSQPPQYDTVNNGYNPVVPLPRYTARPMSIHEKTVEGNPHEQNNRHLQDEKNRQGFELEAPVESHSTGSSTGSSSATVTATMDDASSAYSFPSSFGHTSTDTRDTPPPPYSSCGGSLYSRSRASSLRSHHRRRSDSLSMPAPDFVLVTIAPPPMAHINSSTTPSGFAPQMTQTHAPFNSRSRSIQGRRRLSWESR